ncbi:MAG: peptidyl-prolyl cis-trans isomerase [Candidatus Omnitrophica bacterium]|nr:peptidyl-prolyl cis-trans isomerase [Candidatus Omnitrophota bacterium]
MDKAMAIKHVISIVLFFLCIVIFAGSICEAVVIDKIRVIVNDEVITQREVDRILYPAYNAYMQEYQGERLEAKLREAEQAAINQLIDDKVILSEAKRQDVKATEKEIDEKLDLVKKRYENDEEFRQALKDGNLSLSELRNSISDEVIKMKLVRQEIGWKLRITPSEVRKYYDEHLDDYRKPETVRVFSILIRKDGINRTSEDTRFLIQKIKQYIDFGKDFEKVAKEYSEESSCEARNIKRGEMIKEIDQAIFSLNEGDVSNIIESPIGYHLYKVVKKTPGKLIDFEIVKDEIENLLYKKNIDKNLRSWIDELKKDAYISIQ